MDFVESSVLCKNCEATVPELSAIVWLFRFIYLCKSVFFRRFLLMWHCWKLDPATRPTFNEINSQLGEILEGQNATTAMKKHHQRQVLPRSYGRNGFVLDLGRM